MNSSEELKKFNNISIVNPLVLEALEKLIEKNKTTSAINFYSCDRSVLHLFREQNLYAMDFSEMTNFL